jgi:hypothetical protein
MLLNEEHNPEIKYISDFCTTNYSIKSIPRIEIHNELIVIEKTI